ncbi:molybdenum cofactor guanylyltransferase [Thermoleophilia bacterium SCSIO 60948]|nr:molybdenum cofactor guanylyltransferase [Thermoleophilia bacterium SCSIO 60948]
METSEPVAAILAGGRAERMDGRKAVAPLGGRPLACWVADAAAEAGLERVVVAKPGTELPDEFAELRRVDEPAEPFHPLLGVISALRKLDTPIVALACDAPFVPASLIAALAAGAPPSDAGAPKAIVPNPRRGLLPFPGRYEPAGAELLETALAHRLPMRAAVRTLAPHPIGEAVLATHADPALISLNVNTPSDLRSAELIARRVARRE